MSAAPGMMKVGSLELGVGSWDDGTMGASIGRVMYGCLACKSSQAVEDEQHFLFDGPVYGPFMS